MYAIRGQPKYFTMYSLLSWVLIPIIFLQGYFEPVQFFPLLSTTFTYQFICIFSLALMSQTFLELYISDDDYKNLAFRPVDQKSYFLAKLAATLRFVYVLTAIMILPVILSVVFTQKLIAGLMYVISIFSLQTCITILVIVLYIHMSQKAIRKGKNPKLILLTSLLGLVVLAPTFYFVIRSNDILGSSSFEVPIWIEIVNPFAWFASIPAVADGIITLHTGIGSIMAITCTTLLFVYVRKFLKLDLLTDVRSEKYGETSTSEYRLASNQTKKSRATTRAGIFGHPLWILFFAHFRSDKQFRSTILSMVFFPVIFLVIPLFLGQTQLDYTDGLVEEGFDVLKSTSLIVLYCGLFMLPMLISTTLWNSSQFQASWVLFTAPVRLRKLSGFVENFVRFYVFVPLLTMLLVALFVFGFEETVSDLLLHGLYLGLSFNLVLQLKLMSEAYVPFSQQSRVMSNFWKMFLWMFVASVLGIACAFLVPYLVRQADAIATLLILCVLNAVVHWWSWLVVESRGKRLEFIV